MKRQIALVIILSAMIITAAGYAQTEAPTPTVNKANESDYPYVAEIVGKDIYIRSGAGMNYYRCGKISAPEQVIVVAEKLGWSMIRPPKGSFSWISKRYIDIDPQSPSVGIVKGDNVRVWAGSPYVPPIHSSSMQLKLHDGDSVRLFGGVSAKIEGDYICIEPPKGAYLWINTAYSKKLGPLSMFTPDNTTQAVSEKTEAPKLQAELAQPIDNTKPQTEAEAQEQAESQEVKTEQPKETETPEVLKSLETFSKLSEQIDSELQKPLMEQNYSEIKVELEKLAKDENAGKAARYAEFKLEAIERYETAQKVALQVEKQDENLKQTRTQIQEELEQELKNAPVASKFDITGKISQSAVYTGKDTNIRFTVRDDQGKIVAYAIAPKTFNPEKYLNKKVGLNGTIKPDPLSPIVLIEFTQIELID